MTSFYIFETKPLTLNIRPKGVLIGYKDIVVSFRQTHRKGTALVERFTDDLTIDVDKGQIDLTLTQKDTARFAPGVVTVQVNILYDDAERDVTTTQQIRALDNLHKRVMR